MSESAAKTGASWSIREAIDALLTQKYQLVLLAALKGYEGQGNAGSVAHYHSLLWGMLRAKVEAGAVTMTGFAPGATEPTVIHRDFALDAAPDLVHNRLTLGDVVFEGVRVRQAQAAVPAPSHSPAVPPIPEFSAQALGGWFILRVRTWPANTPFPSEATDHAAANAYFGRKVAREVFRRVRNQKTPENWRKPGPRTGD